MRTASAPTLLGVFVIVHALAHAVIPMRGWIDPTLIYLSVIPQILYSVAVVGLMIAGLGLLGVPLLWRGTRPALVLGSAYSLILLWFGGRDPLWWAVGIDVVLLVIGVSGACRYRPDERRHASVLRHAGRAIGVGIVIYACGALVLWPLHRSWGSAPTEHALALPGDGGDRNAALELQHAVTVNAPPEAVWPWLVQLGQDRAGFYSYDSLERAFGVNVHNVTQIRPEWQQRSAGDRVRATQPDYLGGVLGKDLGWTVKQVEPGRAMVLEHWGAFVLEPTSDGRTRFIIRTRVGDPRTPAWAAALDMMAFELPHFIMERQMMLQIKALAEAGAITRS